MKLYQDLDTLNVNQDAQNPTQTSGIQLKRGITPLEIVFQRQQVPLLIGTALAGQVKFVLKELYKFDSEPIAQVTGFTAPDFSPGNIAYTVKLQSDTDLVRGLMFVDGNPTNDVKSIDCMAEILWRATSADEWIPGNTISVTLVNRVSQDGDLDPVGASDPALAPLSSPHFTDVPTAPTAAPGTDTTQLATTAYVMAVRSALLNGVGGAYDTFKELADLLTADESTAASLAELVATKGDAIGPTSAIDGNLAVFDSTTGKLLKDGGISSSGLRAFISDISDSATLKLGPPGTRTTLTGSATENRAIAFPDNSGTLALLTDLSDQSDLGTMAAQNASAVAITGGTAADLSEVNTLVPASYTGTREGEIAIIGTGGARRVSMFQQYGVGIIELTGGVRPPYPSYYNLSTDGLQYSSAGFIGWTADAAHISTIPDVKLVRAGVGAIALRNATADQTLILGAASGTGGGVLVLNTIASAPTPISGQGTMCVLTAGFNFDRPLNGVGSGLTSVPGALTIDSGWASNADVGDKTKVIPGAEDLAGFAGALDALQSGLGAAFVAVCEKAKALETALASLLAPSA